MLPFKRILDLFESLNNGESLELIKDLNLIRVRRMGKTIKSFPIYKEDYPNTRGLKGVMSTHFQGSDNPDTLSLARKQEILESRKVLYNNEQTEILKYFIEFLDLESSETIQVHLKDRTRDFLTFYSTTASGSLEYICYKKFGGVNLPYLLLNDRKELIRDFQTYWTKE